MKKPTLLAVLLAGLFVDAAAESASLNIVIIPTVGCALGSTNLAENTADIMKGLQNMPRVTDWTTAPSWKPFDYLKWPTFTSSTNSSFYLWMGSPDPGTDFGPDFAAEKGNRLIWTTSVFSTNGSTWEIKDLYYSITCSYTGTVKSMSGHLTNITFGSSAIGVSYRTGSAVVYTNGEPSSTPIQDFYYLGPETSVLVGSQLDLVKARTALTMPGFTITYRVWHQTDTGATNAESSLTLTTDSKLVPMRMPGSIAFELLGQPNLLYRFQQSRRLLGAPTEWVNVETGVTEGRWYTNRLPFSSSFFRAVTP